MNNPIHLIPIKYCEEHFEIPDAPPMSKQQEQELIKQLKTYKDKALDENNNYRTGENYAQDIVNYLNFRHEFAQKFSYIPTKLAKNILSQCQKGLNFGDLFQEGFIALLHAIDLNDFRATNRFSTFASKAVWHAILKFLDNNNRTIRIPSHKIEQIFVHKENGNLDNVTLQSITQSTVSLDSTCDEDGNDLSSILEHQCDIRENQFQSRDKILQALTFINPRSASMIEQYYLQNCSLSEIATKYEISKQRVKQMLNKGIKQLKDSPESSTILNELLDNKGESK